MWVIKNYLNSNVLTTVPTKLAKFYQFSELCNAASFTYTCMHCPVDPLGASRPRAPWLITWRPPVPSPNLNFNTTGLCLLKPPNRVTFNLNFIVYYFIECVCALYFFRRLNKVYWKTNRFPINKKQGAMIHCTFYWGKNIILYPNNWNF